jgi:hypothetical protein
MDLSAHMSIARLKGNVLPTWRTSIQMMKVVTNPPQDTVDPIPMARPKNTIGDKWKMSTTASLM